MPAGVWRRRRLPLRNLGMAALVASTIFYTFVIRHCSASFAGKVGATTDLIDQDGASTPLARLRGRFVVLNFVYTGCGRVCPVQTEQLARVQRALPVSLRERVQFLSVSVDPANDRPKTLKRFALLHGADLANWSFVTGDPATLMRLANAFAAQSRVAASGEHSADIRLINTEGVVVQRYSGVPVAVGRIVDDIRQLATSKVALQ